jgi:predicted nucleic-acid-binding protein
LIGVDTSILVRLLTRDDEAQFGKVVALIQRAETDGPFLLNPLVLTECVWVLERRYAVERIEARAQVRAVAQAEEFVVPRNLNCENWAAWFEIHDADFFDVMIARINLASGCAHTLTFDQRAAARVPGMELLT